MEEEKKQFLEFLEDRRTRPNNIGRSFTYGSCLYDYITKAPGLISDELEETLNEQVMYKLGISYTTAEEIPTTAKAEILDLSELQRIAEEFLVNEEE